MKKKLIIVTLICMLASMLLPLYAGAVQSTVAVTIRSDVAGLTENDGDRMITVRSDNVALRSTRTPILIADYAGTQVQGAMVAGRTYYVYYMLEPVNGYVLPDQLSAEDLDIECGKGAEVIHAARSRGVQNEPDGVLIYAKVVVDSSFIQRVAGWITDMVLKIRAWSLY